MIRSGHKKEKHRKNGELSLHNCSEGTAARTRPLSFDEIMNRRRKKNLSEDVKEECMDVGNIPGGCTIENVSDYRESERHRKHNKGSSPGAEVHVLEEFVKAGSGKKKDDTLTQDCHSSRQKDRESHESETKIKDDKSSKSKHRESRESEIRLRDGSLGKERDKGSRGSEIRLKSEITKENFSEAKGKTEKLIPGLEKIHERSIDYSKDETRKKHSRDLTGNDRHMDETRKKHSRDLAGKDRHVDRRGEKSERESKRKLQNGDDEKNRDKSAAKKVDLGKGHVLEISERRARKESPKSRYDESRLKRRRSRSRKRGDRNRRSISLSPRARKSTSYHGREHEELPSHSSKGRSGRHHSDIDRSRVMSNGSNNHYRRHGGSTSGLGGYSPRKRRTEAAVKTPSPLNRSPEKKSAKWDVVPLQTDSVTFTVQMSNQATSINAHELVSSIPVSSTTVKPLTGISVSASMEKLSSVDSVQLTQATQFMRRLYVENLPTSASERAVVEFLNNFLLSSGVNHIHEALPCISCVIEREKGQALVEFLTAEDAAAALSCDGCSFSGSILKFRHPKDFVEVTSGEVEKSVASIDTISDIVTDSPHKIFLGGISKNVSSKMVMEIASAFGALKAYHFEANEDRQELCAFLEYVDQSVTLKACAGLNGMKVGGQVLTVVQAVPDESNLENSGNPPFYGIPQHALPLLKEPTPVLKLKNVFNPEGFLSLSLREVEEVLEDVQLECARFGTVKSVNVVKHEDSHITPTEGCQANESAGFGENLISQEKNEKESLEDVADHQLTLLEFSIDAKENEEVVKGNSMNVNEPEDDAMGDEPHQLGKLDSNMAVEGLAQENTSETILQDVLEHLNALKDDQCPHDDIANNIQMDDMNVENKLSAEEMNLEEVGRTLPQAGAGLLDALERLSHAAENGKNEKREHNLEHIFEVGCVFVEYRRAEASCMAAHSLHGRLFDDRIVTVEYVPLDLYRGRFPK